MDAARRFPLFARFVARIGAQAIGPENLVNAYIPVHIAEAVERGEFVERSVGIALDTMVGVGVMIVARIALGGADDAYVNGMLLALARRGRSDSSLFRSESGRLLRDAPKPSTTCAVTPREERCSILDLSTMGACRRSSRP